MVAMVTVSPSILQTNVFVCAFLGSTAVIFGESVHIIYNVVLVYSVNFELQMIHSVAIATYLHSSLTLIWINFGKRVTIDNYNFKIYQDYPFQLNGKQISITPHLSPAPPSSHLPGPSCRDITRHLLGGTVPFGDNPTITHNS